MNYAYHELTEEQRRECYERGSFVEEIYNDNITWKPQHEVELHLKYSGYSRGRSSILFYWKDENGLKYPMFVKDFDDILSNKNINTFDFHADI